MQICKCLGLPLTGGLWQAWADPADASWFQEHSCNDGDHLRQVEAAGIPVVVGEWSLATVSML